MQAVRTLTGLFGRFDRAARNGLRQLVLSAVGNLFYCRGAVGAKEPKLAGPMIVVVKTDKEHPVAD